MHSAAADGNFGFGSFRAIKKSHLLPGLEAIRADAGPDVEPNTVVYGHVFLSWREQAETNNHILCRIHRGTIFAALPRQPRTERHSALPCRPLLSPRR